MMLTRRVGCALPRQLLPQTSPCRRARHVRLFSTPASVAGGVVTGVLSHGQFAGWEISNLAPWQLAAVGSDARASDDADGELVRRFLARTVYFLPSSSPSSRPSPFTAKVALSARSGVRRLGLSPSLCDWPSLRHFAASSNLDDSDVFRSMGLCPRISLEVPSLFEDGKGVDPVVAATAEERPGDETHAANQRQQTGHKRASRCRVVGRQLASLRPAAAHYAGRRLASLSVPEVQDLLLDRFLSGISPADQLELQAAGFLPHRRGSVLTDGVTTVDDDSRRLRVLRGRYAGQALGQVPTHVLLIALSLAGPEEAQGLVAAIVDRAVAKTKATQKSP